MTHFKIFTHEIPYFHVASNQISYDLVIYRLNADFGYFQFHTVNKVFSVNSKGRKNVFSRFLTLCNGLSLTQKD